ncbi:MAG: hypothetical protein IJQ34_05935 [Kiritimatiellae bacterium]|nr:hypothetical protein [Kiritimatiellia bacterium]
MKKLMVALGAVAATAALFTAQAQETSVQDQPAKSEEVEMEDSEEDDTSPFEVALQAEVNSAYVSHNRIFSDTPVAQYDLWFQMNLPDSFGWLAADIWANQELNKRHSSRNNGNGGRQLGGIGEFDYEIVYGNSIGPVNFTASHLWYTYPRCNWGSQKFWTFGVEYDNEFIVPSVKYYWEHYSHNDPNEAFMIDFALSRGFKITEALQLKITSKTTLYSSDYAKYISGGELNETVFGGWDNGVALSYALTGNFSLGAHLNYLYKLDHRVRHCPGWDSYSVGGGHSTHDGLVYGGVSATLSF